MGPSLIINGLRVYIMHIVRQACEINGLNGMRSLTFVSGRYRALALSGYRHNCISPGSAGASWMPAAARNVDLRRIRAHPRANRRILESVVRRC